VPITSLLRERVIRRDAEAIWLVSEERIHHGVTLRKFLASPRPICLMRLFDPRGSAMCSGRTTLDHVKDQPMMGKKAPDDEWHLTALCLYHNSFVPPSRAFRTFQRAYLADARRKAALETGGSHQPEVEADRE
jgi:hypothetical protein